MLERAVARYPTLVRIDRLPVDIRRGKPEEITDINNDCIIEKDKVCSNDNISEAEGVLVEERGVGEILETSGNFITNAGSRIAEAGDDCEEEDNIVEATGKCLHYFGKIFTIIGKFLKKLFF